MSDPVYWNFRRITDAVRQRLAASDFDGKLPTVSTILHLPGVPWVDRQGDDSPEGAGLSLHAAAAEAWIDPLVEWFKGRAAFYHDPNNPDGVYRPSPLPRIPS